MRLNGAAAGHVLGIEVENHPLTAIAIKRDRLAGLRGQGECGRGLAYGGHRLVVSVGGYEGHGDSDQNHRESDQQNLIHEEPPKGREQGVGNQEQKAGNEGPRGPSKHGSR